MKMRYIFALSQAISQMSLFPRTFAELGASNKMRSNWAGLKEILISSEASRGCKEHELNEPEDPDAMIATASNGRKSVQE
ncbi:MAG: hypothetical protein WCP58_12375 [bacterium]